MINKGGVTIKISWNRTTADTLRLATRESLPRLKRYFIFKDFPAEAFALLHFHSRSTNLSPFAFLVSLLRPEIYRSKLTVYYTLQSWTAAAVKYARSNVTSDLPLTCEGISQFQKDFVLLLGVFKDIIAEEWDRGSRYRRP